MIITVIIIIIITISNDSVDLLLDLGRFFYFLILYTVDYRLCGLVVRVLGYRAGGPGSIPGTTKTK
jgi:hypothetical protein